MNITDGSTAEPRYYRSDTYRFRREFFGCYAWAFFREPLEIAQGGANILRHCEGKTIAEICTATGYNVQEVRSFLIQAEKACLVQQTEPVLADRFFDSGFYREYCLSAPRAVFFEVTWRCNLKCRHCYTSSGGTSPKEVSTQSVIRMLDDMAENGVFLISYGGGEPLLREDIITLIKEAARRRIEVSLSTNGWYITAALSNELRDAGVRSILVSLDGANASTHDAIRGDGSFEKARKAIELLVAAGHRVAINFCAMRPNIAELPRVVELGQSLGCSSVRALRLSHIGRARQNEDLWLSPVMYVAFIKELADLHEKHRSNSFQVVRDEAFLGAVGKMGNRPRLSWLPKQYTGCPAARSFIFVNPKGDVYPCGFMENPQFLEGNIVADRLLAIWQKDDRFGPLRRLTGLNSRCDACAHLPMCAGGCRGTALSVTGDWLAPDPLCPVINGG